jgi:hypothetical protein
VNRNKPFVAPIASLILAIVAAVLTLPASVAVWEQRALISEDGFVALGNDVLANEAVQQELAAGITEDIGGGSDSVVGTVLGSILGPRGESPVNNVLVEGLALIPNTPASDLALSTLHNEFLEAMRNEVIGAEGDSIYIDLNDAIAQVVPGGFITITTSAGRIEVVEKSDLAGRFRVARWLDGRAFMLALLPIAVAGMGFFLAPSPGRYAMQVGGALLAVSALALIYVKLINRAGVVNDAVELERSRDAAYAVYDIFTRSLVMQELLLAVAGLIIAGVGFMLTRREGTGV